MYMMDLFSPMREIGFVFFDGCHINNTTWGIKFSDSINVKNSKNSFLFACYVKDKIKLYDFQLNYNNELIVNKKGLKFIEFKKELINSFKKLEIKILSTASKN